MSENWLPEFYTLPKTIQTLLKKVVEELSPKTVVLFGSRARKTHRENSDFDIALTGVQDDLQWTKFINKLEEEPWTLYGIDLVLFEGLGQDYKTNIAREGKVLYEQ